jgi:glycosyltransferase involved in cell wall biosynthesis
MSETHLQDLICLSHLRWEFVFQRPQHLLTRATRDYSVTFVEEPIFGADAPSEEVIEHGPALRVLRCRLPDGLPGEEVDERQRALLDRAVREGAGRRGGASRPDVLWYYTPMALTFSRHVEADVIVFDKMDELSAFRNAPQHLLELEEEMMRRADVVFTGGASMFRAARHRHPNIHCFPSSIDRAHFAAALDRSVPEPPELEGIAHPRIGYFGVIDERFDAELLAEVATLRPDYQFVVIGPVVKIDPAVLPRLPNIHWLGGKPYQELPSHLGHWDAGFMPFALNEATRFISPTKTPEFLAAGLAVVSTRITDVVSPYGDLGLVAIADGAAEMASAIDEALKPRSPEWRAAVDRQLSLSSWDSTWKEMHALIDSVLTTRRSGSSEPSSGLTDATATSSLLSERNPARV